MTPPVPLRHAQLERTKEVSSDGAAVETGVATDLASTASLISVHCACVFFFYLQHEVGASLIRLISLQCPEQTWCSMRGEKESREYILLEPVRYVLGTLGKGCFS